VWRQGGDRRAQRRVGREYAGVAMPELPRSLSDIADKVEIELEMESVYI
jgi:hypothetical protein